MQGKFGWVFLQIVVFATNFFLLNTDIRAHPNGLEVPLLFVLSKKQTMSQI